MAEDTDTVGELQVALGWAPSTGPEEQAAYARMGGQLTPDAPTVPAPAPAPAPEQAPAPAPTEPVAPVPGSPPAPNVDQKFQQEANQKAGAYKQQLITQGWEDQAAHHAASQYARAEYQEARNKHMSSELEQSAQSQIAVTLGTKHGIDPAALMGYTSPAAMEAGAKALGEQNKRLAALEGAKTTPKTPSQSFDSGTGTGMTQQQRKIAYATGQINLTTQEFKNLYGR